jgi:Glycosyltransferase family 87
MKGINIQAFHLRDRGDYPDLQLFAWGVLLELALLFFWEFSGAWRGSWRLIAAFFLPAVVFCLAAGWMLRAGPAPVTRRTRWILLGFAALYHLTLLFTPQPVSNDLYRYFWDGKLLSSSVNPYTYPPAAVELEPYRDEYWGLIFNRDVPTGYPPLAEALFAAAYRLRPDPWLLRGMAALASLGAAFLLAKSLRAAGQDERRALLYAWSPLVALEFANSGHLDAYALLCMSAALLFALKRRPLASAVWLALGGLVKFFPVLLLPVWGRRWGRKAWLAFTVVFSLPWLPFIVGGTPFTGLGIFAGRGDFNGSLYRLVEELWYLILNSAYARLWARLTVFTFLALIYVAYLLRRHPDHDILAGWRFAGFFMGLCLLLSPVVHPWYVCWMLAFLAIEGQAAWLVLSVTVIFARQVYIGYEQTGEWQEAWWPSLAVWIPFYLALAVSRLSRRNKELPRQMPRQEVLL